MGNERNDGQRDGQSVSVNSHTDDDKMPPGGFMAL